MKIPLAYESTLFDSAPVSVENGLRILLSDTSIPSSLVMRIHVLLSDRVLPDGSITTGRGALAHLSHSINENYSSILKATYLQGREVFLGPGCLLFEALRSGGVAVGRIREEGFGCLSSLTNDYLYYFDPLYSSLLPEGVERVEDMIMTANRKIRISSLGEKDRVEEEKRELLILERV